MDDWTTHQCTTKKINDRVIKTSRTTAPIRWISYRVCSETHFIWRYGTSWLPDWPFICCVSMTWNKQWHVKWMVEVVCCRWCAHSDVYECTVHAIFVWGVYLMNSRINGIVSTLEEWLWIGQVPKLSGLHHNWLLLFFSLLQFLCSQHFTSIQQSRYNCCSGSNCSFQSGGIT